MSAYNNRWIAAGVAGLTLVAGVAISSGQVFAEPANELYAPILTALQEDNNAEEKAEAAEISKTGYCFRDLNGDGTDELLIGIPGENQIAELYAIVDGKAEQIVSETEGSTYTLSEYEGKFLICQTREESNGEPTVNYFELKPESKSMYMITGFIYSEEKSTEDPYYLDYGLCELQPTDASTWEKRKGAFSVALEISYEKIEEFDAEELEQAEQVTEDVQKSEEQTSAPAYVQISQETAQQMMQEDDEHVIVDVRRQDEYDEGHIVGAILIPNETINTDMPEELPDKDQIILVYCRSGNRSKQAAQKLADMGYTKVFEFGGINTWNGETEKD